MPPPWATIQKGRQLINGRTKGAQFERKIAKELFLELGLTFKRNLEQYRAGNHGDLTCDNSAFPWTIECKRYASGTGCRVGWMEQAQAAADAAKKMPAVVWQYDRRPVMVTIPLAAICDAREGYTVDLDFETFCYVTRELMNDDTQEPFKR